ncbi:MAG: NAD-dependent malic enzyme [Anaerolineae bacterium]|nr:NAD-dependent malic enzyme [Anaerolineae bacterium]
MSESGTTQAPAPNIGCQTGTELLHNPALNKGTAFTAEERDALGLRGLLPPHIHTIEEQVTRVMENFYAKPNALEKYIHMIALLDRNETLFYRVVVDHVEEMMPIIYTPTVGQGCQEYGRIFRRPRGIYISAHDRGRVAEVLRNWPCSDVRVIVVTDGERILGLGDLGADGMGIPVGKLALYTACAGVHPSVCLPVTLDVGTDNEKLLDNPLYIGIRQKRLRGAAYDDLVEEFMVATQEVFPNVLVQFEDFANINAFRLLTKYRDRLCTFNDDIQGTGGVALAGIYSALRITGGKLPEQRILFMGAGEAATGIADLIVSAMVAEGLTEEEARGRLWLFDSSGLVVSGRDKIAPHKVPYAHEHAPVADFLGAVNAIKPTGLIGVSGQAGTFTQSVLARMAQLNDRPIIFALSNPTSKAECTAEQAYGGTHGRCVFASGSPFPPVTLGGKTFVPGQGNNAYVFPGIGLGIVVSGATRVPDEMFFASARVLADLVSEEDLAQGRIYPSLANIRQVSAHIAAKTAEVAYDRGLNTVPRPDDILAYVKEQMYEPIYHSYV